MKIILVDDEPLITEGLARMISELPIDNLNLLKVNISSQALEICFQEKPDLLITDIKMPGMDGTQLVAKLREHGLNTPVVFASSYDDFDYVKKAMQLGGTDYLLKPIQQGELSNVIQKVVKQTEEKKLSQQMERIKEQDVLFDSLLRKYFGRGLNDSELTSYKNQAVEFEAWDSYSMIILKGQSVMVEDLQKKILKLIDRQLPGSYPLLMGPSELLILTPESNRTKINQLFANLVASENLSIGLVINKEGVEELRQIYPFLRSMLIEDISWIIDFSRVSPHFQSVFFINDVDYQLRMYVNESNFAGIDRYIAYLFEENYQADEQLIRYRYLTLLLYRIVREKLLNEKLSIEKIKPLLKIKKLTLLEIESNDWMYTVVDVVRQALKHQENQYSPVIQNVIEFVSEDLTKRHSLKSLASRFNMNPAYLGQLFQKEVGKSFKSYDHDLRMSEAQRLIRETTQRITTIAESVGYEDISHFYRHYKKDFGMTPNKARKNF